jgi:hypothetical protein
MDKCCFSELKRILVNPEGLIKTNNEIELPDFMMYIQIFAVFYILASLLAAMKGLKYWIKYEIFTTFIFALISLVLPTWIDSFMV